MPDQVAARAELERRLAELQSRTERIEAHLHEKDREVPRDSEELAQYRENDEVVDALDDMTRTEMIRMRNALVRMDAGTWGTCTRCEEPIEDVRLEAVPTAATCLACMKALEPRR